MAKPVAMKVTVATTERGDSRAIPHTPCPLVQPPPVAVPNPTSSPATAISPPWSDTVCTTGAPVAA